MLEELGVLATTNGKFDCRDIFVAIALNGLFADVLLIATTIWYFEISICFLSYSHSVKAAFYSLIGAYLNLLNSLELIININCTCLTLI